MLLQMGNICKEIRRYVIILLRLFVQNHSHLFVEHPCRNEEKEADSCCLFWTKKMGNNLEAMMKVMRFANRRGRPKYDLYSIVSNGTTKILQYTLKDMREKGKSSKFDLTSIIPMCFLHCISPFKDMS